MLIPQKLTEQERHEIEEEEKIRLESKGAQSQLVFQQRLELIAVYIAQEREKWRQTM